MSDIIQVTTHLGEIRGKTTNGVTQFLGIKYATLKNRLADAELVERRDGGVLDALKDGPTAISPLGGCDLELSAIQHTLPKKELTQSDVDCLNLNIAAPAGTPAHSKLPVFVFIHGGGLMIGANSWPQFDYERFVKLSIDNELPIVAVSINYRLGPYGFLTSDELRKAGYKANNGLRDQRVALEWVRRHIVDFGGDSENITVAGMSAGAASVTFHLDSETPLFKRAILMSGSRFFVQALPYDAHEENYRQAISALGLENATSDEKIKALLETPGQDLLAKLPPSVLTAPAVDGDMVPSTVTYAQVADRTSNIPKGKQWCRDLLIGDAQYDSNILAILMPHLKNECAGRLAKAVHSVFPTKQELATRILAGYGLTAETADDEAFPAVLNYLNDIFILAPTLTYTSGWEGHTNVYYFNEENPWEGPWQGKAGHILDVAYLFQNFRDYLTPAQQELAAAFAIDFFKFCHGIKPWPTVVDADIENGFTARVYGPSSEGETVAQVAQAYGGHSRRSREDYSFLENLYLTTLHAHGFHNMAPAMEKALHSVDYFQAQPTLLICRIVDVHEPFWKVCAVTVQVEGPLGTLGGTLHIRMFDRRFTKGMRLRHGCPNWCYAIESGYRQHGPLPVTPYGQPPEDPNVRSLNQREDDTQKAMTHSYRTELQAYDTLSDLQAGHIPKLLGTATMAWQVMNEMGRTIIGSCPGLILVPLDGMPLLKMNYILKRTWQFIFWDLVNIRQILQSRGLYTIDTTPRNIIIVPCHPWGLFKVVLHSLQLNDGPGETGASTTNTG
ncbi:tRNA-splicing endonuclease subunit sen54 N-term family protein [Aspergillus niger]|uniref:tRNA-splicing endonuclease subunit sen54 N-term family protein n=1 Tax=Aspergillus niger TaxID=5061 RepID=A0A505I3U7_ASPNG|nr:tRNA-splicing endonuclease subunit sen54 N-term family protein [Aspergillus niger]